MSAILIAEQILNGLQFGVMLFLMAAGLTLIFGVMGLINLAHGSLYMIGAFAAAAFVAFLWPTGTGGFGGAVSAGKIDAVKDGIKSGNGFFYVPEARSWITEYPAEERRYDHPDYEALWAASAELNMPLSLHTATRRVGTNAGSTTRTIRDASRRATKAFLPAISVCDMMYSGVFDRHPDFKLAIVEFELAWVPYLLSNMDYTYRERHDEATYRFKNDLMPSDLFAQNVFLSFQEDDIGIRLRDVIGVDRMMWGSDYPHSESTFPHSQQILDRVLGGLPDDEIAAILGGNAAEFYDFDVDALAPLVDRIGPTKDLFRVEASVRGAGSD